MEILVGYDESLLERPVKYAITTLLEVAGVPHRLLPLSALRRVSSDIPLILIYGPEGVKRPCFQRCIHVCSTDLFDKRKYLRPDSLPTNVCYFEEIPFLFYAPGNERRLERFKDGKSDVLVVRVDIFASTFFLLTCYEEIVKKGPLDKFGRFPSSESILGKFGLLHRPLVHEYAELLKKWINSMAPGLKFAKRFFHGRNYALVLTHDIDLLHLSPAQIFPLLKRKRTIQGLIDALSFPVTMALRKDPFCNLRQIVKWEAKLGVRSTFYFLTQKGRFEANYEMEEVSSMIGEMVSKGWEVGFHAVLEQPLTPVSLCNNFTN